MYASHSRPTIMNAWDHRRPMTLWSIEFCQHIPNAKQDMSRKRLTISSVQTLRIQTFSFPSIPSTLSNSTPSHQHLRAGFLQNSRSFCAMPTAGLVARASPLTSVRRRARAKLQMTVLLGSPARWPHRSSLLKPLEGI